MEVSASPSSPGVTLESLNAKMMRGKILPYLLLEMGALCAAHEFENLWGRCDIFGVKRDKLTTFEVEIKVNKYDLESELKAIRACKVRDFSTGSKRTKHAAYLTGAHGPSQFYFAVPPLLIPSAIIALSGTPYGLIAVDDLVKVVKRATRMHERPVAPREFEKLCRRMAIVAYLPAYE